MPKKNETMKGIKSYEKYNTNPYLNTLVIPTRNKTIALANKQLSLFDNRTGEVEENIGFMGLRRRVDTEEFVKIYKAQIQALFDLSPRALKVFGYFMETTRISTDTVIFRHNDCMKYTGYSSKASVNHAISELLEKEFIARTQDHFVYYVNPAKLFNGDRLVLFQDIVLKGSKADKRLQENDPLEDLNQRSLDLEGGNNPEE